MMAMDIGVNITDREEIDLCVRLAQQIGFAGIAVLGEMSEPVTRITHDFMTYRRIDLRGKGLSSLRDQIDTARKRGLVVAMQLGAIEATNWAAEDPRVDLLTLDPSKEYRLRDTTAHLATSSSTYLEIQIAPLLSSTGLNRSKILKSYREAVITAIDANMGIVLSSGATYPMGLRSPVAMVHIGMLLGLERGAAEQAVIELPARIIERNMKRMGPEYVRAGVEIRRGGKDA
jgi:RNase P/RNase MRP subunit p30